VFFTILHRTILGELLKVFLLALVGLTGILLIAGIIAEASQHGLGPKQILMVIPLIIPNTMPYTLPATTLFATCIVYGRLSNDNEILAIKAAGVNVLRVIWPCIFLGIVTSAITLGLYLDVIPSTHHLMRTMFLDNVEEMLYEMLKRDHQINQPRLNYKMWVLRVHGKKLEKTIFKQYNKTTHQPEWTAYAAEADMMVDRKKNLIRVKMLNGEVLSEKGDQRGFFVERIWEVPLPEDFNERIRKRRASDLTWNEIEEMRKELVEEIERKDAEIALLKSQAFMPNPPPSLRDHINLVRLARQHDQGELRGLDAEIQMRPALALGCLCFVLVGCPVGIFFSKSDILSAFITCFLPIVFLYYPLLLCGINLAKNNDIPPALTVWFANGVVFVLSLDLFRRLLKN
jgi:lipopolysaccharide export system permease protein